jgi:hypothetical protein
LGASYHYDTHILGLARWPAIILPVYGRYTLATKFGQMKKPPVSGFDIHIDGVWRTFRDRQATAYDAAKLLKQKNRWAVVTIINTATGKSVVMLEDGRTG